MVWYYIVGFFALIMAIRFVTNLSKFYRVQKLYRKYIEYLGKNEFEFAQYKEEIKSLFKEAGLKDSSVLHQEFLGFGKFAKMHLSVYDNLTNRREDIVSNIHLRFNEAIGVYRKRYSESYNPIFWIDFIVKLPQYIMQFFGVLPEKIAVKIFVLIYWIAAILFGLKKFDLLDHLTK